MSNIIKTTLASFLLLTMGSQVSFAQGLSANDISFAFGGTDAAQEAKRSAPDPLMLSIKEMKATEGEFWPIVYGAASLGTRAFMWAAPRISSSFRTIHNPASRHTLTIRNNRHVCQIGCDRFGNHVGWGSGGRNGMGARHHIYQNSPWRINPF